MIILQALYFMLPAYLANMMPVLVKPFFPWWSRSISEKFFGSHKTWRGIFAGICGGIIMIFIQREIGAAATGISLIDYQNMSLQTLFLLGFLFGFGALIGDLIKSFFKRRLKIAEGQPWIPFDQLDFVTGALLATSPLYLPSPLHIAIILILTPFLHLASNIISYKLGWKKVCW